MKTLNLSGQEWENGINQVAGMPVIGFPEDGMIRTSEAQREREQKEMAERMEKEALSSKTGSDNNIAKPIFTTGNIVLALSVLGLGFLGLKYFKLIK